MRRHVPLQRPSSQLSALFLHLAVVEQCFGGMAQHRTMPAKHRSAPAMFVETQVDTVQARRLLAQCWCATTRQVSSGPVSQPLSSWQAAATSSAMASGPGLQKVGEQEGHVQCDRERTGGCAVRQHAVVKAQDLYLQHQSQSVS